MVVVPPLTGPQSLPLSRLARTTLDVVPLFTAPLSPPLPCLARTTFSSPCLALDSGCAVGAELVGVRPLLSLPRPLLIWALPLKVMSLLLRQLRTEAGAEDVGEKPRI